MGKLILSDSSGQTQEFPLDRERMNIGRHPDNDIVLVDKAVSGHHAAIITILQDSFLEDLDSTNGTQVNGQSLSKHPLSHGDVITIGRNHLRYEGNSGENDYDQTMMMDSGKLNAALGSPAPEKPRLGRLRVISGPNAGKELELSKALTTVGKPGVQVAAVTRRVDGYYIVHVGGGTAGQPQLNGAPLDTQARKLNEGDSVELLGTQMVFVLDT